MSLLFLQAQPWRRRTTTLATGNSSLSRWHWKNGGIGWREHNILLLFSPITRTFNSCGRPSDLIPVRIDGHYTLPDSILPSHFIQVQKMLKQMLSHDSKELIVSPNQWTSPPVSSSNASTATPPGCPPGLKYVSRIQRTPLIHSSHTSLGTGHSGTNSTLSLLKDRF